jgi:hypothetical protein
VDDLRPSLTPLIITDNITQGQHRIDMGPGPVHATAFQARLNHQFVGAFSGAVANRPTRRHKGGILHVGLPLLQIGQVRRQFGRFWFCRY